MKPRPPTSQEPSRSSRLDSRKIYLPAEIPVAFQTGYTRFEATRPSTSDTRRVQNFGHRYVAEKASYFPKIRENAVARESREKQIIAPKQTRQVWKEPTRALSALSRPKPVTSLLPAKPLSTLDQNGMAAMRFAFKKYGRLSEKDFVAEMLAALNAKTLSWEQQVELTQELASFYLQADLHAVGYLTWGDFCSFFSKTYDAGSLDEVVPFENLDCETEAINTSAEVHGMYFFENVDKIFVHDAKKKGFRMVDASTNTTVGQVTSLSSGGSILDAVYSPTGRYVMTASTSPVIAIYDIDELCLRQQIPTKAAQTTVQLALDPTPSRLYSCCTNGQLHVWNLESLTCTKSFFPKGHEAMTQIAVIESTDKVAVSCLDGKIYVLDVRLERVSKALNGHRQGVTQLKYCANKSYLISGGLDHNLHLWNPHVEQQIGTLQGHRHQLVGLDIMRETNYVISADESGLIKIWDLRKFSAVRTIKRETYIKDQSLPRTLTRPMRSMCYMQARQRIAIAHSSIFFLEQRNERGGDAHGGTFGSRIDRDDNTRELEERLKPLAVVFHQPSQSIVLITSRAFQSWSMSSGNLLQSNRIPSELDVTCVSVVDDQYSCMLGTENGVVARAMLPRGSVVISKRIHGVEVVAVRWVRGSRLVVTSSTDGAVLVSMSATLEVLYRLDHWRGVEMLTRGDELRTADVSHVKPSEITPLSDVDQLKHLFGAADYSKNGKITTHKADELLDSAFAQAATSQDAGMARKQYSGREVVTLTMFLKKAANRLKDIHEKAKARRDHGKTADVAAIDVHGYLQQLVTVSPLGGNFCVWNFKGGTPTALGDIRQFQNGADDGGDIQVQLPFVSQVVYLDPYPYFVLVEEGDNSQLSIWSSIAIPPRFPHGHQCILRCAYGASGQEQASTGPGRSKVRDYSTISAVYWASGGSNGEDLFCVGDDQGNLVVYEFDEVFAYIEKLSRENPSSKNLGADALLPSSLLHVRCRREVPKRESIRSLCAIQVVDRSHETTSLLAVVANSGKTLFFSLDGSCLGVLGDDQSIPWQLNMCTSDATARAHVAAVQMLREMKSRDEHQSTLQQHDFKEKEGLVRGATSSAISQRRATSYATERPSLSRFLALTKQL